MALNVKDSSGVNFQTPLYGPAYSFGAAIAPGASPTDIVQLKGSATKIVRLRRVLITLSAGTAAGGQIYTLVRRSTAASGGTAVTDTPSKHDTTSAAATAVLTHYTAAPTAGTAVAVLRSTLLGVAATTAATEIANVVWDFTGGGELPKLASDSEFLCVTCSATLGTAQTLHCSIEWQEDAA